MQNQTGEVRPEAQAALTQPGTDTAKPRPASPPEAAGDPVRPSGSSAEDKAKTADASAAAEAAAEKAEQAAGGASAAALKAEQDAGGASAAGAKAGAASAAENRVQQTAASPLFWAAALLSAAAMALHLAGLSRGSSPLLNLLRAFGADLRGLPLFLPAAVLWVLLVSGLVLTSLPAGGRLRRTGLTLIQVLLALALALTAAAALAVMLLTVFVILGGSEFLSQLGADPMSLPRLLGLPAEGLDLDALWITAGCCMLAGAELLLVCLSAVSRALARIRQALADGALREGLTRRPAAACLLLAVLSLLGLLTGPDAATFLCLLLNAAALVLYALLLLPFRSTGGEGGPAEQTVEGPGKRA